MKKPTFPVEQILYKVGQRVPIDSEVIVEAPVSLTVNGEIWLTLLCTPIDLEALAVGFLYNESLIQSFDEIGSVEVCSSGDNIDVWINHSVNKPEKWLRTSGCTGGYTTAILDEIDPLPVDDYQISSSKVLELIQNLFKTQDIYRKSGGVHASAIASTEGIILQTEDVGRHNTLDKIAGRMLLEGIQPEFRIILSTGRISSEMLQKAARLKASILISRTSPTSMSLELAEKLNITLIGYARGHRFNVYTHPKRIEMESDRAA